MKCSKVISDNAKFCKIICAAYSVRWGDDHCSRVLMDGKDAICTMWPELERLRKYGGKS